MTDPRLIPALLQVHPPIGSLEMNSTFQLRTSAGTGTCFLYHGPNGRFFVTAKHLLRSVSEGEKVFLAHATGWDGSEIRKIFLSQDHDLGVFTTGMKVGGYRPEHRSRPGLMPGQPMKFLGFPHGLKTNYPNSNGYLSPLVRTAYFSGVVEIAGKVMTILDGFNNPGYSGSPVYTPNDNGEAQLFAVISGYRYEKSQAGQVYRQTEKGPEECEGLFVNLNSGMIYAVGLGELEDLFEIVDDYLDELEIEA